MLKLKVHIFRHLHIYKTITYISNLTATVARRVWWHAHALVTRETTRPRAYVA